MGLDKMNKKEIEKQKELDDYFCERMDEYDLSGFTSYDEKMGNMFELKKEKLYKQNIGSYEYQDIEDIDMDKELHRICGFKY